MYTQRESLLIEPVAERATAAHRPEPLVNRSGGVHGRLVDAPIEEQHDEHRYIERAQRRVHHIPLVVGQFTYPWAGQECGGLFIVQRWGRWRPRPTGGVAAVVVRAVVNDAADAAAADNDSVEQLIPHQHR